MRQLLFIIRKEFYHVFRDRRTLLILFGLPTVEILLFGFALSSEVKNIGITVFDQARDRNSQQIVDRIRQSAYFIVKEPAASISDIEEQFRKGVIKCALVFPPDFDEDLYRSEKAQVQVITDGADPNTAKIVVNYLTVIIGSYQEELNPHLEVSYRVIPEVRELYNEEQNWSLNFVPGVIALIFMIVSTALTSVAVVREKELGTMEILLVSPLKPYVILIAKVIPYLVLSLIDFIIILLLSVFVLDVQIQGSIMLLFAESILFIITCLSLGLLISNVTTTQQSAMLVSMMSMMVPTTLLTGFMFPLENLPWIFQAMSHFIPSRYYYIIVKSVMLKGLGFSYIWKETLILLGMTLVLLGLAIRNFKIRLS